MSHVVAWRLLLLRLAACGLRPRRCLITFVASQYVALPCVTQTRRVERVRLDVSTTTQSQPCHCVRQPNLRLAALAACICGWRQVLSWGRCLNTFVASQYVALPCATQTRRVECECLNVSTTTQGQPCHCVRRPNLRLGLHLRLAASIVVGSWQPSLLAFTPSRLRAVDSCCFAPQSPGNHEPPLGRYSERTPTASWRAAFVLSLCVEKSFACSLHGHSHACVMRAFVRQSSEPYLRGPVPT